MTQPQAATSGLPPLTGIAPWLAIAAAIGLVLIQVGGTTWL